MRGEQDWSERNVLEGREKIVSCWKDKVSFFSLVCMKKDTLDGEAGGSE